MENLKKESKGEKKMKIIQTKLFDRTEDLNEWLKDIEPSSIKSIDFQHAGGSQYAFFVQYFINAPSNNPKVIEM